MPTIDLHLGLFFAAVIQSNERFGRITSVYYGLKWFRHALQLPNPRDSKWVKTLMKAAKRLLSRVHIKKEPMSPCNLKKLGITLKTHPDLLKMRMLTMAILSYARFFRYAEVSRLRRSDILFEKLHMKLFINCSTTLKREKFPHCFVRKYRRTKTCLFRTTIIGNFPIVSFRNE